MDTISTSKEQQVVFLLEMVDYTQSNPYWQYPLVMQDIVKTKLKDMVELGFPKRLQHRGNVNASTVVCRE